MEFDDDEFSYRHRSERSWMHHLSGVLRSLIALTAVIIVIGLFWPELQRQREIARQNTELEATIAKEEQKLAERTRQLDWLRNDPQYVELLARDRLNLQKEGETIFRFNLPDPVETTPR